MAERRRLVIVGNGMAGARLVEDIVAANGRDRFEVTVLGEETHAGYNRILLSGVLAGTERSADIVMNPASWYAQHDIDLRTGRPVTAIDARRKSVRDATGEVYRYDVLVLATGSHPVVPPIEGIRDGAGRLRPGAFVFRTLDDCEGILACAGQCRRAVVVGGGLLGLEAARGLLGRGLGVTVLHLPQHLLDAQLDADGGRILRRQLEELGLEIRTGAVTTAVLGDDRLEGVRFSDGSTLACDMVVIAAGIRPNVDLARAAGLPIGRGILVGDDLAVSGFDDLYAIGECAEHRGQVCGLVAPAWDQARVVAERLTKRNPVAAYTGSRAATKLKVAGVDVAVMGVKDAEDDDDEVVSYCEPLRGVYKKLIVRRDRLAGAIVIGDSTSIPAVAQAYLDRAVLPAERSELLFPTFTDAPVANDPESMPDTTQVCDCNAVSKAAIVEAVLGGARSVQAVCAATRASTGCGACRPEVERIVAFACKGWEQPELLSEPIASPLVETPRRDVVVTLNKIERIKQARDGLDVRADVPAFARAGWQALGEDDRERLKWLGVFFRRQTPGQFMMRIRMANGITSSRQLETIADLSEEFGTGSVDITTRQQIQLRGFTIEHLPAIWDRLERAGLTSLQTGMDNVRNVVGCAVAGLTPGELFDASPVAQAFTSMFLGNRAFSNLPRKFNVAISACTEHCTHGETQDVSLTPAVADVGASRVAGFNVAIGGKMGSGGCAMAAPLDLFVEPERAATLCAQIALLFRDCGPRGARTRARLFHLLEEWGPGRMRGELEQRMGTPLRRAGRDARGSKSADHLGVHRQKQEGLNYVGCLVAVGRLAAGHLRAAAHAAARYGDGEMRLTTGQNIVIANVPDRAVPELLCEPVMQLLPPDPPGALRGLVACTGTDYCHFALIETKSLARRTAEHLAAVLPPDKRVSTHWSGCPAGCGNHAAAQIGLLGKNIRVNGVIVEAVDVFVGGRTGPNAKPGVKVLEDVPCDEIPAVLERLIPYVSTRRPEPARVPLHDATA